MKNSEKEKDKVKIAKQAAELIVSEAERGNLDLQDSQDICKFVQYIVFEKMLKSKSGGD